MMETTIVYTLVSSHDDFFLEQLLLSIYSVKRHNNCRITIVTETETEKTLINDRSIIYQAADKIISTPTPPHLTKTQKSRFLKTRLREFITGDYLFLDCDTIVCGELYLADNFSFDIAAVADVNGPLELRDQSTIERCHQAGFKFNAGRPYFNSGVMFVKDTANAHALYREWHAQWIYSTEHGVDLDQPALCQANANTNFIITEIPGEWNCQVNFHGINSYSKAIILHYAGGANKRSMQQLFHHLRNINLRQTTLIQKLLDDAKRTLFALMTITDENFCNFCNSSLLYYYHNAPFAFKVVTKLTPILALVITPIIQTKSFFKKVLQITSHNNIT